MPQIAAAQSLKEKLVRAYTLVEGSEVFADGKKVVPWAKGSLQLSPTGRVFFLRPTQRKGENRQRQNASGPDGRMVRQLYRR